jgi:hypothetical protein
MKIRVGKKVLSKRKVAGFGIIEVIIVLVLMGLAAKFLVNNTGNGVSDGARAKGMYSTAQQLQGAWSMLVAQLGISPNISGNALLANSSNTILDILMVGDNPAGLVAASYTNGYANSGVKPLSDVAEVLSAPAIGTAGSYAIYNYTISLSFVQVGNVNKLNVTYSNVPFNVLNQLYSAQMGTTATAGSTVSTGKIQYSPSGSNYTVTVQLQM